MKCFESKKPLFIQTFILFIFEFLMIMTAVSGNCGNISKLGEGPVSSIDYALFNLSIYLSPFFIPVITTELIFHSVSNDYCTRWRSYSYTLPVSAWKYNSAFYISVLAAGTFLTVIIVLSSLILSVISNIEYTGKILCSTLFLSSILILYSIITYNILLLTKSEKAAKAISAFAIAGLFNFVFIIFFNELLDENVNEAEILKQKIESFNNFVQNISPLLPFIIIGSLALNWFISVKLTQRREN